MKTLLLLIVLISRISFAGTPLFISGVETANNSSDIDSYEFSSCADVSCGSAPTNTHIKLTSTRAHDSSNGGDSTSHWAAEVTSNLTSAVSAYYKIVSNLSPQENQLYFGASVHLETKPGAGKRGSFMAIVESDGDFGCALSVDENKQITLFYSGGSGNGSCSSDANCAAGETCQGGLCFASWGVASTVPLQPNYCSTDPLTKCLNSSDCPGTSPTCSGIGYYGVELGQLVGSSSSVVCELWVDGVVQFAGTSKSITYATVANSNNIAFGGLPVGTPDRTFVIDFDDIVVTDDTRAGHGYVARKVPLTEGTYKQWSLNGGANCSGSAHHYCVNDFDVSPYQYYTTDTGNLIEQGTANRTDSFATFTSMPSLPSGTEVPAVEVVSIGNTSGASGKRDYNIRMYFGSTALLFSPITVIESGSDTVPKVRDRRLVLSAPVAGSSALSSWINNISLDVMSGPLLAAPLRIGAVIIYVRVRRADPQGQPTLQDHDLTNVSKCADVGKPFACCTGNGTGCATEGKDGKITIFTMGDSTDNGTASVVCNQGSNAGIQCTQNSYASWDTSAERDKPSGGCASDAEFTSGACSEASGIEECDKRVQVCTLHKELWHSNGGLPCYSDPTNGCKLTCTGGFCIDPETSAATTITCNSNPDCDIGPCLSTATCKQSCPGGTCPSSYTSWSSTIPLKIPANTVVSCGSGGEKLVSGVLNRLPKILNGADSNCTARSGFGNCQCSNSSECGGGGSCVNGICISGDSNKTACTTPLDCQSSICQFPRPDYLIVLEYYNDPNMFTPANRGSALGFYSIAHDPECSTAASWVSSTTGYPLAGCPTYGSGAFQKPPTYCTDDSSCSSVSPSSMCAGWDTTNDKPCWNSGGCSVATTFCQSDFDCYSRGLGTVCTGKSTLTGTIDGHCTCTSSAGCPANYACVGTSGNKMCRATCSTAGASCGTGSTCTQVGADKVCQGRCTLPCSSISCNEDYECSQPGGTILGEAYAGFASVKAKGKCNKAAHKCACCGPVLCGDAGKLVGACSCSSDADCPSGVCTNNLCASGTRSSCVYDNTCASNQRCMRCSDQFNMWHPHHGRYVTDIINKMITYIDTLHAPYPPQIVVSGLPAHGGKTPYVDGNNKPVVQSSFQGDDGHYDSDAILNFYNWASKSRLPTRRLVDMSEWNKNRGVNAYHTDKVHYNQTGANEVANIIAASVNKLNVCLKTSDNSIQKYCRNPNLTFKYCLTGAQQYSSCTSSSDCSGATCGSLACSSDAGCPSGKKCFPRKCDGVDATCEDSGDYCGLD